MSMFFLAVYRLHPCAVGVTGVGKDQLLHQSLYQKQYCKCAAKTQKLIIVTNTYLMQNVVIAHHDICNAVIILQKSCRKSCSIYLHRSRFLILMIWQVRSGSVRKSCRNSCSIVIRSDPDLCGRIWIQACKNQYFWKLCGEDNFLVHE
jgi:hypothetical protein